MNEDTGFLAEQWCGKRLALTILSSAAGFYIGTADEGWPCSRESIEYFPSHEDAAEALQTGNWTQKTNP